MKNLIWVFAVATLIACNSKPDESGEEDNGTDTTAVEQQSEASAAGEFGAPLSEADVADLNTVLASLDSENTFTGKIKVEIDDVCQMKGCWMTAKLPDGRSIRVTFKDYGFFVPKNATGYTAIIEGVAEKKITDEETLKHYAQESGKSQEEIEAIQGPGEELTFVAEGVVIEG